MPLQINVDSISFVSEMRKPDFKTRTGGSVCSLARKIFEMPTIDSAESVNETEIEAQVKSAPKPLARTLPNTTTTNNDTNNIKTELDQVDENCDLANQTELAVGKLVKLDGKCPSFGSVL